jgi:hypothetical protein
MATHNTAETDSTIIRANLSIDNMVSFESSQLSSSYTSLTVARSIRGWFEGSWDAHDVKDEISWLRQVSERMNDEGQKFNGPLCFLQIYSGGGSFSDGRK